MAADALDRAIAAIDEHRLWSRIASWDCELEPDPMWHKKDRFRVTGKRRGDGHASTFCTLHFRIRNDGVGVVFTHDENTQHWNEIVMPEWQGHAVGSALLSCAFLAAVPPSFQRKVLNPKHAPGGEGPSPPDHLGYLELKDLQAKFRKSMSRKWPDLSRVPWFGKALRVLEARHEGLGGADVKEQLQKLVYPFKFLISRGVPFEQVRLAWDAATVRETMES